MKVLVVVDYQNDFVNGALGFPEAAVIDEGIAELALKTIAEGGKIIATLDTHGEDYLETLEGKNLPVPHTIKGTYGWKIYGKTGEAIYGMNGVIFIEKPTFPSDKLIEELRRLDTQEKITEIHFVGVVSNMCVLSNIIIARAALPNARIILHEQLTKGFDQKLHDYTMEILKAIFVEVV